MEKSGKSKIIISVMAAALALIVLLLVFSAYQLCIAERELYESTDPAPILTAAENAASEAGKISRERVEQAKKSAREVMDERIAARRQRYLEELLVLVNPWNTVPEDYKPRLSTVEEGYLIDRRCANALMSMVNDCREAGNLPVICSAYRTHEYQEELYRNKILRLLAAGVDNSQAPAVAAQSVAVPGTSEHQLGLAVDIIDELYVNLDQYQQYTSVQKWLMAHCSDYGFILRYPNGSSDITGIIFEPWHYRYVGVSTAKAVEASGLTFEEYLLSLE